MRQVHLAVEKCFIDNAGRTVSIVNATIGEFVNEQIHMAVLGASGHTLTHASLSLTEAISIQGKALLQPSTYSVAFPNCGSRLFEIGSSKAAPPGGEN